MKFRRRKARMTVQSDLEKAVAEREESERRYDEIKEKVIKPLREKEAKNQFAEMIKTTLLGG